MLWLAQMNVKTHELSPIHASARYRGTLIVLFFIWKWSLFCPVMAWELWPQGAIKMQFVISMDYTVGSRTCWLPENFIRTQRMAVAFNSKPHQTNERLEHWTYARFYVNNFLIVNTWRSTRPPSHTYAARPKRKQTAAYRTWLDKTNAVLMTNKCVGAVCCLPFDGRTWSNYNLKGILSRSRHRADSTLTSAWHRPSVNRIKDCSLPVKSIPSGGRDDR